MMTYPKYWQTFNGIYWLESKIENLSALLVVKDRLVEFELYNGRKFESRVREFLDPDKAKNFAIRFGRVMKRVEKSNTVPSLWNFSAFR